MQEIKLIAREFLGEPVAGQTSPIKVGILASIDIDGHCVVEYKDGTQDVTHYTNIPTIINHLESRFNEMAESMAGAALALAGLAIAIGALD